jgi:photosystem II stability/assembly factor-like uncharacterized protein
MRKIGILILVFSAISLLAQPPGIDYQKDVFTPLGVNESKSKECAWQSIGPDGGYVNSLAFNPKNHSEIYASAYGYPGRIYKTVNSGRVWEEIVALDSDLGDIAIDPKNSDIIYVLGGTKIFKTEDESQNWEEYPFINSSSNHADAASEEYFSSYQEIVIHPKDSKILYVSGKYYKYNPYKEGMAVAKSANGGKSWSLVKLTGDLKYAESTCIAINPLSPNVMYAGGYFSTGSFYMGRLYKSTDGGNNWTNITGIVQGTPRTIVIDKNNPNKVYVGSNLGIYRSSDGGQTWQISSGDAYAYDLAIDPYDSNILYAGGWNFFYKSTDGGATWASYSQNIKGVCNSLLVTSLQSSGLAYVYSNSTQVYFGSSAGIYKSVDSGVSWKESHAGIKACIIPSLAVAPSSPNTIYAEVRDNGFFRSYNSGASWTRLPDFDRCDDIRKIKIDPNDASDLFILVGG